MNSDSGYSGLTGAAPGRSVGGDSASRGANRELRASGRSPPICLSFPALPVEFDGEERLESETARPAVWRRTSEFSREELGGFVSPGLGIAVAPIARGTAILGLNVGSVWSTLPPRRCSGCSPCFSGLYVKASPTREFITPHFRRGKGTVSVFFSLFCVDRRMDILFRLWKFWTA